jgi:hypothetical protein
MIAHQWQIIGVDKHKLEPVQYLTNTSVKDGNLIFTILNVDVMDGYTDEMIDTIVNAIALCPDCRFKQVKLGFSYNKPKDHQFLEVLKVLAPKSQSAHFRIPIDQSWVTPFISSFIENCTDSFLRFSIDFGKREPNEAVYVENQLKFLGDVQKDLLRNDFLLQDIKLDIYNIHFGNDEAGLRRLGCFFGSTKKISDVRIELTSSATINESSFRDMIVSLSYS